MNDHEQLKELEDHNLIHLIKDLRGYITLTALDGEYEEAAKCRALLDASNEERRRRVMSKRVSEAEDPEPAIAERRREHDQRWQDVRQRQVTIGENMEKELMDKQIHELKLFEKKWEKRKYMYCRGSTRLLGMLSVERHLAGVADIETARAQSQAVARMREAETEQAQERYSRDYLEAKQLLHEKQDRERRALDLKIEDLNRISEGKEAEERAALDMWERRHREKRQRQLVRGPPVVDSRPTHYAPAPEAVMLDLVPAAEAVRNQEAARGRRRKEIDAEHRELERARAPPWRRSASVQG